MEVAGIHSIVNSSFQCSLCLDIYKDPRILNCGHTYCLHCLQNQFKSKNKSCALCRKTWVDNTCLDPNQLPKNFAVQNFLSTLPSIVQCIMSGKKSEHGKVVYFCIDCWDPLCSSCGTIHTGTKLSKNHLVKKIYDIDERDIEQHKQHEISLCALHNKQEYIMYCEYCETVACAICFITCHKKPKCNCVDLIVADKRCSAILVKEIEDCNEAEKKLSIYIDDVKRSVNFLQEQRNEICSLASERKKLQEAYDLTINKLLAFEKLQIDRADTHLKSLQTQLKECESKQSELKAAVHSRRERTKPSSSVIERLLFFKQREVGLNAIAEMPKISNSSELMLKNICKYTAIYKSYQSPNLVRCLKLPDTKTVTILSCYEDRLLIGFEKSEKLIACETDGKILKIFKKEDPILDAALLGENKCINIWGTANLFKTLEYINKDDVIRYSCMLGNTKRVCKADNCVIYSANGSGGLYSSQDNGSTFTQLFYSPDRAEFYDVAAVSSKLAGDNLVFWVIVRTAPGNLYKLREYTIIKQNQGKRRYNYYDIDLSLDDPSQINATKISPSSICYDNDKFIYVCDQVLNSVYEIDVKTKARRLLLSSNDGIDGPTKLAIDNKGQLLYVGQSTGRVLIFALNENKWHFKIDITI